MMAPHHTHTHQQQQQKQEKHGEEREEDEEDEEDEEEEKEAKGEKAEREHGGGHWGVPASSSASASSSNIHTTTTTTSAIPSSTNPSRSSSSSTMSTAHVPAPGGREASDGMMHPSSSLPSIATRLPSARSSSNVFAASVASSSSYSTSVPSLRSRPSATWMRSKSIDPTSPIFTSRPQTHRGFSSSDAPKRSSSSKFNMFVSLFFKKRFMFMVGIAWLAIVMFPLGDPSQVYSYERPRAIPVTKEELSNLTLSQNEFFRDQLLFSSEVKAIFTIYMRGVSLAPGEFIVHKGDPPAFLIVENGTLSIVPNGPDDKHLFVDTFSHGDGIGGLNVYYKLPFPKGIQATNHSEGTFVWFTDHPDFIKRIQENELLGQGIERKALKTLLQKSAKKPVIFIPGFASTQLIAWKEKNCFGTTIQVGDRVWLNLEMLLHNNIFQEQCWLRCMMLDVVHQTDPIDCKLRPEEGLNSIYDLAPGLLGPITTIFKTLITNIATNFGYDVSSMLAIPYDWRLAPKLLEDRDQLYTKLKLQIEANFFFFFFFVSFSPILLQLSFFFCLLPFRNHSI